MRTGMAMVAALLIGGCAHHETNQHAESAWEHSKEAFGEAYAAVKEGGREVAHSGRYAFERTREGTVRVFDQTKTSVGRYSDDAWITTRVKTAYSVDRDVPATRVHVTTRDGVVSLGGVVDNEYQAEKAIETALRQPGVAAVNSDLAWPVRHQARTYKPGGPM